MPKNRVASTNKPLPKISTVAREKPVVCMADPGLGIKTFSLLAAAPGGEQRVDLVVNPLPKAFFARPAELVGSPGFGDAPSVMSVSASSIAITAKGHLSATGAQGC